MHCDACGISVVHSCWQIVNGLCQQHSRGITRSPVQGTRYIELAYLNALHRDIAKSTLNGSTYPKPKELAKLIHEQMAAECRTNPNIYHFHFIQTEEPWIDAVDGVLLATELEMSTKKLLSHNVDSWATFRSLLYSNRTSNSRRQLFGLVETSNALDMTKVKEMVHARFGKGWQARGNEVEEYQQAYSSMFVTGMYLFPVLKLG